MEGLTDHQWKVADLGEMVDYWKQVLAGLDILLKTFDTPE